MDFYVLNHFAPDGSLLLREPCAGLDLVHETASEIHLHPAADVTKLRADGDTITSPDGTTVRLDVL